MSDIFLDPEFQDGIAKGDKNTLERHWNDLDESERPMVQQIYDEAANPLESKKYNPMKARQFVKDINLPFLGAATGEGAAALLGAGSGGLGLMALPAAGALGGAAGKGAENILLHYMGDEGAPGNLTEQAKSMAGGALSGGEQVMLGQSAGALMGGVGSVLKNMGQGGGEFSVGQPGGAPPPPGGVVSPFASGIDPERAALAEAAANEGIPMNQAEVQPSRWRQTLQRFMEMAPFAQQQAQNQGMEASRGIQRMAGDFLQDQTVMPSEEAGPAIGEGIENAIGATESPFSDVPRSGIKGEAQTLYDRVGELAGAEKAPMTNYDTTLDNMLDAEKSSEVPNRNLINKLMDLQTKRDEFLDLQASEGGDPESLHRTFNEMRDVKSRIGDLVKDPTIAIGSKTEGAYKQLTNAIQADIDRFANDKGGELLNAYQKANAFYGPMKELMNSPVVQNMQELAKSNPTAVVDAMKNAGDAGRITELLGPEGMGPVKQQLTERILEQARQVTQGSTNTQGIIQGGHLANVLNKYGDEFLSKIYSPEELGRLKQLAKISNMSLSSVAANSPITGGNPLAKYRMMHLGGGGATMLLGGLVGRKANPAHPIQGAVEGAAAGMGAYTLGVGALARMVLSEPGSRWLTTGFPDLAQGAAASAQPLVEGLHPFQKFNQRKMNPLADRVQNP